MMKKIIFTLALVILFLVLVEGFFRFLPALFGPPSLSFFDRSPIYFKIDDERLHPWNHIAEESRRIVVVGDSFAQGVGVQLTDRFAHKLERMLNANRDAPPFRVDVLARPGTSTFQQIGLLNWALELDPELVVLALCLNDTEDWTDPRQLQAWRRKMIPRRPSRRWERFFSVFRLAGWTYNRLQAARARRGYLDYYRNLYDPSYSGWKRFQAALSEMREACREREVAFLVLIFPLLSDRFERGYYPFEFAHRAIREQLEGEDIDYVDALAGFRNTYPLRMAAIPAIDPHPSEIAHRIVAEILFDHLFELGLLGSEYLLRWRPSEKTLPERWRRAAEQMGIPLEFESAPVP